MNKRLLLLLPIVLAACGYKGPLSLPKTAPTSKPAASAPTPATGEPSTPRQQEQK